MATKKASPEPFVLADSLLAAYATNHRINVYLIQNLPEAAWRMKGPGGKGRDAASMIGHMHNVRLMWLKAIGLSAGKCLQSWKEKSSLKATRLRPWKQAGRRWKRHCQSDLD